MITSKWTNELIRIEGLKYTSRAQWKKNSNVSYQYAVKRGLINHYTVHMDKKWPKRKWTNEALKKEAEKYKTRNEWIKKSPNSYAIASQSGRLHLFTKHMHSQLNTWTLDKIQASAIKYKHKIDWQKGDRNAYAAALARGIVGQVTTHMNRPAGTSIPEQQLQSSIIEHFQTAIPNKLFPIGRKQPPIRFELDLFIPELNKGIELNGDYWHTEAGFTRSWIDSCDDYHRIKRNFFKRKGIEYLEIWESDWNENSEACIKRCIDFLQGKNVFKELV